MNEVAKNADEIKTPCLWYFKNHYLSMYEFTVVVVAMIWFSRPERFLSTFFVNKVNIFSLFVFLGILLLVKHLEPY